MAAVKMRYGLLWYDADKKRSARAKIDEAAERYVEKFGDRPDTCYVHPEMAAEHPELRVLASPLVLPNHFLLGVEQEPRPASVQRAPESPTGGKRSIERIGNGRVATEKQRRPAIVAAGKAAEPGSGRRARR